MTQKRHPFGEVSCENEIKVYKEKYSTYYFNEAPFNDESLKTESYLIIGRRGTGKSSLAQYFNFQKKIANSKCVHIDDPSIYSLVLERISQLAADTSELAIPRLVKIWTFIIWSFIFEQYKNFSKEINAASIIVSQNKGPAHIIKDLFEHLLKKYTGSSYLSTELEDHLELISEKAKQQIYKITKEKPIIIAIDSLERYDINNDAMMWSTAALVQCASEFNDCNSHLGLHIKVFMTGEIFPYLRNQVILNVSKYVKYPVYLHWRPKDLAKLVSWRFSIYLKQEYNDYHIGTNLDWSDFPEILKNMWIPYFSDELKNSCGIVEKSFPYVLRHTQMRPRQLIIICNKIAELSKRQKTFPKFSPSAIREGIKKVEEDLAVEIYNSYSKTYENLTQIVGALDGIPLMFKGKHLDKIAPTTASSWPRGDYSKNRFHQLVTELGIVGKIRKYNKTAKIVEADFEYAMEDTIPVLPEEDYVIHPMFFSKLNITEQNNHIVIPFPSHSHFREIM